MIEKTSAALPKIHNISVHDKSQKHQNRSTSTSRTSVDEMIRLCSSDKEEPSLAIACHSSIRAADHFDEETWGK